MDPEKLKRDREELEKRQREGESFFVVWIRSNRVIVFVFLLCTLLCVEIAGRLLTLTAFFCRESPVTC